VSGGCGPSAQEEQLQGQESSFLNQYSQAFNQNFAGQENILNSINSSLNPILQKGINQTGYSSQELNAMNTGAINNVGANYANAARALNGKMAGMGDSTLQSGVSQQLQSGLASAEAGQLSGTENQIVQNNYAQGRQNYLSALSGEQGVAQMLNPQSYASLTQQAQGQGFGEANTTAQQQAQAEQAIAGGATSLALGGLGNLDTTGGSTGGEQFLNFLGGL
jgi:hypothetical protein